MATVEELEERGELVRIDVLLGPGDQVERCILALPPFVTWIEDVLPYMTADRDEMLSPQEQFEALAHEFVTGGPMPLQRRFKPWIPAGNGTWWLKTTDLRLFGWFPRRDHFIAALGAAKADLVRHRPTYREAMRLCVDRRRNLDLTEPKFIPGVGSSDVLSDPN